MSDAPALPRITGYELLEELGRGGMATVYVARQQALNRQVAIKVVHPKRKDDEAWVLRLENEAQALAGLHHPHIVDVYEFGRTDDDALYYVMPLLRGGDLTRWQLPVAEDRVTALLDDLLDALAHAHVQGIVHRDIKPENILFDTERRPHLADFGAALRPSKSRLTGEGMVMGSTGYMSPEQARGQDVDARSDLYSLAVVAFELLTGKPPFGGADDLAIALAQCEQPVPKLPRPLAAWQPFFDRALAVDPQQRFDSAVAMREAMHLLVGSAARSAAPQSPRRAAWVVGALLVAATAIGLWQLFAPRPPTLAEVESMLAAEALRPRDADSIRRWLVTERAAGRWTPQHEAQVGVLIEREAEAMRPALLLGDAHALLPLWQRWHDAVIQLGAGSTAPVRQRELAVEALMQQSLRHAFDDYDLAGIEAVAMLIDAGAPIGEGWREAVTKARTLPAPGSRFADAEGPELQMVESPSIAQPGLAIMRRPVDDALHQQFNQALRRTPGDCVRSSGGLRSCLPLEEAQALAEWLSARTGERYRLPSRDELTQHAGVVDGADLAAWTSTCHSVTTVEQPKRMERAWGKVKSVFGGKPAQAEVHTDCQGHYTIRLREPEQVQALERPDERTAVVLVRDVTLPTLPDSG
ncbi:MAG: protein kinase [Xanthomonadales bacterium]|nr:protein kinase [Xanthomonadales bacterium]